MVSGLGALDLLIIDDSAQMRTIVGTVLSAVGIRNLHHAPDGKEALRILSQRPVDLVYVDYEMPVMNGLDFISAVRALETKERYLPIIMLTGHSALDRLYMARDRGVTEFLRKPVTSSAILERLNTVILKPRGFVSTPRYFGPDRRRRSPDSYLGPMRRQSDAGATLQL